MVSQSPDGDFLILVPGDSWVDCMSLQMSQSPDGDFLILVIMLCVGHSPLTGFFLVRYRLPVPGHSPLTGIFLILVVIPSALKIVTVP